jgi:hypothetical protein
MAQSVISRRFHGPKRVAANDRSDRSRVATCRGHRGICSKTHSKNAMAKNPFKSGNRRGCAGPMRAKLTICVCGGSSKHTLHRVHFMRGPNHGTGTVSDLATGARVLACSRGRFRPMTRCLRRGSADPLSYRPGRISGRWAADAGNRRGATAHGTVPWLPVMRARTLALAASSFRPSTFRRSD